MAKRGKSLLSVFFVLLLVAAGVGYYFYKQIYGANVNIEGELSEITIPSDTELDDLAEILLSNNQIKDKSSFLFTAQRMKFFNIKPGKFELQSGWSNVDLIRHLRSGNQKPVKFTFNNIRFIEELGSMLGEKFEMDGEAFVKLIQDEAFIASKGYNNANIMSLFIPNTYEMYWNITPEDFIERMEKEHKKFWSKNDRIRKARDKGLSPSEIYTLASIVEKETRKRDEKPRVAGVYLNRLKKNIALQADPTVVYANGDFTLRRVLYKHLEKDSPYNTYKYTGLPPGPIYMPDVSSIDAVLNAEDHNYLYFCAKPDGSGYHAFAATLAEHNRNANKFHQYLNKNKIR